MSELRYEKFIENEGKRWFWARTGGGLFCEDLATNEIKCIYFLKNNNIMMDKNCEYGDINIFDNKLLLTPRYATEITVWDIDKKESIIFTLPENPKGAGEFFLDTIITDNEIIFFPQTYHGILHLNRKTNTLEMNSIWYKEIEEIYSEEFRKNEFCFRALPIRKGDFVYLPFYNIPKVLKYNLKSREYTFLDTKEVDSNIEILSDDGVNGLILQRLDVVEIDNSVLVDYLFKEFLERYHLIKAIDFYNNIYFFTDETIFYWDIQKKKMEIVEYMYEIEDTYRMRLYTKGSDRFADTLSVYKRDDVLHINFENINEMHQLEIDSNNNLRSYCIKEIIKHSELQILIDLIK